MDRRCDTARSIELCAEAKAGGGKVYTPAVPRGPEAAVEGNMEQIQTGDIGKQRRKAVERMFRQYPRWCARKAVLEILLAEMHAGWVKVDGTSRSGSPVESETIMRMELATISNSIAMCEACLLALNKREYEFVVQRYFKGFSIAEIARQWGLSRTTVRRVKNGVMVKCAQLLCDSNLAHI